MPVSEARVLANRANALKSTGPKTPEGKERSRANSYKHGLTGGGIVMPEREAAEVERRVASFAAELKPAGGVAVALVRRAAVLSVRMERCVDQENAALTDLVRRAESDFEAPEGLDEAIVAKLRAEAGRRAMFDASPEATLARRYEAAAERGFFRALKELRQMQRSAQETEDAFVDQMSRELLGSIAKHAEHDPEFAPRRPSGVPKPPSRPFGSVRMGDSSPIEGGVDVPISIGRRR